MNWTIERMSWIDRRLGQLGIDVRQHSHHEEMRHYIHLLEEELRMTMDFMAGDGAGKQLGQNAC